MTVKRGKYQSEDASIHYLDWGGEGPPLILIHATGFLAALWQPIAEHLSSTFRVIAMDQRGHGDSDKPASGYTFELFADDLQRLIEELELEPADAPRRRRDVLLNLEIAGEPDSRAHRIPENKSTALTA